jgi:hypothetical protein
VAVRSPPRIDWAPDDDALVSYRARTVQLHDQDGRPRRELAHERIYDVRWCDDGHIIVLDDRGSVTFTRDGELAKQTNYRTALSAPQAASLSSDGSRYVALTDREIFAVQLTTSAAAGAREHPEQIWTFHARSYGVSLGDRPDQIAIEMSPNGELVAIGYTSQDGVGGRIGRGWLVIELASDQFLQRAWIKPETRVGRAQLFAFDVAGTRLAHGVPDLGDTWGVTCLDADDVAADAFARTVPGGAHAVALDRGGQLAAYAYPKTPPGARGRLRVDYLSPAQTTTGTGTTLVLDTLSIDPELPDLVAVAFSRDSRQLACLASTGAIEIVPVP